MKQNQGGNTDQPSFNRIYITYARDAGFTDDDFRENFESFGTIKQVHISKEKSTNQPKGLAYIRFTKTSEACLAVEEMNGQQMCGHPRSLKVHIAHEKNDNLEIDVDKDVMLLRIFVRHPKTHKEEELRDHFSSFGNITWLYMLRDKETKESRGSSFVKYEQQSEAAKALEECNKSYKARWADVRIKDGSSSNMGSRGGVMGSGMGSGMGTGMSSAMDSSNYGFSGAAVGGSMGGGMGLLGMGGGAMNNQGMNNSLMGPGGMGGGAMGGGAMSSGGMGGMSTANTGGPMNFLSGKANAGQSNKLEALVPSDLSQEQIFRLFDIAPGLQACTIDQNTGLAKLEYATTQCAAHAREKIDGLDVYGYTIAVRMSKNKTGLENTAMQLQETLSNLQNTGVRGGSELNTLVQSIQQVTQALQQQGMGGSSMGGNSMGGIGGNSMGGSSMGVMGGSSMGGMGGGGMSGGSMGGMGGSLMGSAGGMGDSEMVPWCNVPLPSRKPMVQRGSPERAKLYVLCKPQAVSNEVFRNAFCRFGNLIHCGFAPGKNYGFVVYSSVDSADAAVNALNGNRLLDNQLKVEFSTSERKDGNNGEAPSKRPRQW